MRRLFLFLILAIFFTASMGQRVPVKSIYFKNPFLVNAAYAGMGESPEMYLNYMNQWSRIDGSPVNMSLSGHFPVNDRVGFGGNLIRDKAGIMSHTQATLSYAYLVPLTREVNVRFGLSLGFDQSVLDLTDTYANANVDPELSEYNVQNSFYVDGDFGALVTYRKLEGAFSVLNLNRKRFNQFDSSNSFSFYSSVAYPIALPSISDSASVKPLLMIRGVNKSAMQWDVASLFTLNNQLSITAIYHSNKSVSAGLGIKIKDNLQLQLMFSTSSAALNGFTGGTSDALIGYRFAGGIRND